MTSNFDSDDDDDDNSDADDVSDDNDGDNVADDDIGAKAVLNDVNCAAAPKMNTSLVAVRGMIGAVGGAKENARRNCGSGWAGRGLSVKPVLRLARARRRSCLCCRLPRLVEKFAGIARLMC